MRQDTPNTDDGILTNGNVLLEERLDLLDFLDDVHAEARAAEKAETERRAPAWMVARQATVEGAVRVLQDEVAPAAPWQLQVGRVVSRRHGPCACLVPSKRAMTLPTDHAYLRRHSSA